MMDYSFAPYLPFYFATDAGGVITQAADIVYPVEYVTAVQHSPSTSWSQGTPYPGPPSTVHAYVDTDAIRYWGRMGQGALVWSDQQPEISADLPPMLPQDLYQHVDTFQGFWGGYPSIARNRPSAFGDQVPALSFMNWEG